MPKLPAKTVGLSFFLYRTEEEAKTGGEIGGTGFFVGIQSTVNPEMTHLVAITNWHVAVSGGSSVIRLNKAGGGTEVFEFGPEEWVFVPNSYDVAALPFDTDASNLEIVCVRTDTFATRDVLNHFEIGPGEDVFMPGRFVNLAGAETNVPGLRFGNISMMPQPIKQKNFAAPDSYCIDMHSRDGYSGSPVFVYRTLGQVLDNPGTINPEECFMLLLGVHWGQFPEYWEIKEGGAMAASEAALSLSAGRQYVEGRSGMTCVAPAWAILELLEAPKIKAWLKAEEQKLEPLPPMADGPAPILPNP